MPKKLPYFKFDAESWLSGKIQLLPVTEIGIFINLAARIWQNGGNVKCSPILARMVGTTPQDFTSALEIFKEYELIYLDGDSIRIKFIDEQLAARASCLEANRRGGIQSAISRANRASVLEVDFNSTSSILQDTSSIKIREDKNKNKIREDNKENISNADIKESSTSAQRKTKARPESAQEVIDYCQSRNNGIDGQFFWDHMEARGWVFKDGRPVKDWEACVRTWERYNAEQAEQSAATPSKNTRATYPGDEERGKEFTNGF